MNRSEAKAHRDDFLNMKIEKMETKLRVSKSWSVTDTQGMRFRTPAKIFEDLGGNVDPTVIEGVVRGCLKCTAMGPPWLHTHPQTGLKEFVIIEFSKTEVFTKVWEEFSEGMKKELQAGPTTGKNTAGTSSAAVERAAKKAKRGGAKGLTSGEPTTTTPPQKDTGKDKLAAALKQAHDVKKTFAQATAGAVEITRSLKEGDWKKWVTDETSASLNEKISSVQGKLSPFHREFVRTTDQEIAFWSKDNDEAIHQLEALIQLEPDRTIHQRRLDALLAQVD
jgi:hypothetical protein